MATNKYSVVMILLLVSFTSVHYAFSKNIASGDTSTIAITKEKLMKMDNIEEILPGFPKEDYIITELKLSTAGKGVEYHEFAISGDHLSKAALETIQSLPVGTKLYFEYIKGRRKDSTDHSIRIFPPAAFVLSEK